MPEVLAPARRVGVGAVERAAALLREQPPTGEDGFLDPIDEVLDYAALVDDALPGEIFDKILEWLGDFHEVLESLTGDSDAIRAHGEHLRVVAASVAAQSAEVQACGQGALAHWRGPAADRFARTVTAAADCEQATAEAVLALADAHLRLGSGVAAAKFEVLRVVTELAYELSREAVKIIIGVGLLLSGAGVVVLGAAAVAAVAAAVGGGVVGGVKGGLKGLVDGNPFDAGADAARGAAEGAEEALKSLLQAAVSQFLSWGGPKVAEVLREVHDFVEESVEPLVVEIGRMKGHGNRMARAASLLTTGTDPGPDSSVPQDGTAGRDAQGAGPQALDGKLIDLNQAIGDPEAALPDGYQRVGPAELAGLGLTPDMLTDPENGFLAEVFRAPDGSYVVAFGGTGAADSQFGPDINEDAVGSATVSPQTANVLAITDALSGSPHGDDVVYTGHSLGGRHAAVASLATGNAAVTYNAAGVSDATVEYIAGANGTTAQQLLQQAEQGQVRHYSTGDDPLTAAQERWGESAGSLPDAPGTDLPLSDPSGDLTSADSDYLSGHVQGNVEEEWNEKYGAQYGTTRE